MLLFCVTAVLADDEWREVKTAQGPVRGRKHPSADLYAFYNIPYATAPVGQNKFKVIISYTNIGYYFLLFVDFIPGSIRAGHETKSRVRAAQ